MRPAAPGIWDRDVSLLDGVAKFELEVMDPAELRNLLVGVLDDEVLDCDELERVKAEEETQRGAMPRR